MHAFVDTIAGAAIGLPASLRRIGPIASDRVRRRGPFAGLAAAALILGACGGSDNPMTPTSTGANEATITIGAGGVVSPSAVTITSGNHLSFVNNDTVAHTMSSDPHPVHTDCPALNVGTVSPGQSRATGDLTVRRTCGFHDHDNPDTASLKGTVTVQ